MAKQCGPWRITGTIGNISFYKTSDGYLARMKGGVDAKRFRTDDKFARSRENAAEFGRAAAAGGVLRRALKPLLANGPDRRLISHLTATLVHVLQADTKHPRGQRCVADGDLSLLHGLEMSSACPLFGSPHLNFQTTINRAPGHAVINIPGFDPVDMLNVPAGATHFRLAAAAVEADFGQRKHHTNIVQSNAIPVTAGHQPPIALQPMLRPGTTQPVFVVLGIQFLQEINGALLPLNNHHPLAIVATDSGGEPKSKMKISKLNQHAQSPQASAPRAGYGRENHAPSLYPRSRAPRTKRAPDREPRIRPDIRTHSPPQTSHAPDRKT